MFQASVNLKEQEREREGERYREQKRPRERGMGKQRWGHSVSCDFHITTFIICFQSPSAPSDSSTILVHVSASGPSLALSREAVKWIQAPGPAEGDVAS